MKKNNAIKLVKSDISFDFNKKEVFNNENKKESIFKSIKKIFTKDKFILSVDVFIVIFTLLTVVIISLVANDIVFKNNSDPAPSIIGLDKVNKVILYETILFDNNDLYKLQNNIYKNLNSKNQNVNFMITNPELLVFDFNIKKFQGLNLAIGNDSKIDININKDKKIISYSNFTKAAKETILKELDTNNYQKVVKTESIKNKDDTYNISFIIDK